MKLVRTGPGALLQSKWLLTGHWRGEPVLKGTHDWSANQKKGSQSSHRYVDKTQSVLDGSKEVLKWRKPPRMIDGI
jgi:hypothetical protein